MNVNRLTREFLENGLDPATADRWELQRTRVTSAALLVAIVLGVALGSFYATIASPMFWWVYGLASAGWLAGLIALRATQSPTLGGHIGLGVLWWVCVASFWLLGGFGGNIFIWIFVLPIAAAVVSTARGVWITTAAAAVTCAVFWMLPRLGIELEDTLRPEYAHVAPLLYHELALGVISVLLWIWLGTQRELEDKLTASLTRAEEQRQNVVLMLEASAASNASAGFRDVAARCLESVVCALDAQLGRFWRRAEGGALEVVAEFRRSGAEGDAFEEGFAREFFPDPLEPTAIDLSNHPGRPHRLLFHPILVEREPAGLMELHVAESTRESALMLELMAHVAGQIAHVAERERSHSAIRDLAYVDVLSQLPNRLAFQEKLPLALARQREHGRKAALLFVDLNGFKRVNDSLGHDAGDALLREVANRLRGALRMSDHLFRAPGEMPALARFGGDEFTVLAIDLTEARGAEVIAGRILEALAAPVRLLDREVAVGASIGIALFPDDAASGADLIQHADQAMYRAKLRGGSAWERYDGRAESSRDGFELGEALRHALDAGELAMHYQPIFRAIDGVLLGAEALVRWSHPTRGAISPAEFIPLAEATGQIERLGAFVLEQICRQATDWTPLLPPGFRVAANISPRQLHAPLEEQLRELFERTGCDPARIEIELTESALLVPTANIEARLRSIVALGVNIALDDFGTGYSSLAFLKQFPIAKVKIDRGFVKGLPDEKGDIAITRAILAMAQSLGLSVVAEGVEDEAQHEFLTRHGCDAVQGYLLGRPIPAAEFRERWLAPG